MKKILALIIFITTLPLPGFAQWYIDRQTNTVSRFQSHIYGEQLTPSEYLSAFGIVEDNNYSNLFMWKEYHTGANTIFFRDIQFLDSMYGWACGNGFSESAVKTTDGGLSWSIYGFRQNASDVSGGVFFLNKDTGWIVGIEGRIRKTTNGGGNWITQDLQYFNAFSTVHFFNSDTGIVAGNYFDFGAIWRTTNGGTNWVRVYTHPEINTVFSNQTWLDSSGIGWLYGGGNILLKSNDYGQTFLDYFQHFPAASNGKHYFSRLYFINENTGWASGSDIDDNNMHKTTDGGFSWVFQDNPVTQFFFTQLNDCVFLNKDTGWASSVPGIIISTTNGGEEWFVDLSAPREFWPLEVVKSQSRHFIWSGTDLNRLWKATIDKTVSISSNSEIIPDSFKLFQNYPNPFNPVTTITFSIPHSGRVQLNIYNALGQLVSSPVSEHKQPGTYSVTFDASDLPSGVYYYKLDIDPSGESGNYIQTRKMVLLK